MRGASWGGGPRCSWEGAGGGDDDRLHAEDGPHRLAWPDAARAGRGGRVRRAGDGAWCGVRAEVIREMTGRD